MAVWKKASAVFFGGTQQALDLKGRRVRNIIALQGVPLHDPGAIKPATTNVPINHIGFLANPLLEELLIAYPKNQQQLVTSLDSLVKSGAFFVVKVNWPTFKARFEIEV